MDVRLEKESTFQLSGRALIYYSVYAVGPIECTNSQTFI